MTDGSPAAAADAGGVAFDAADRLAILNLVGAYAHTYDDNRLDAFRDLFTESPEMILVHRGRTMTQDIDTVMNLLAVRKADFKAENNQRRHAMNSIQILTQTSAEATGQCYVQVFAIRNGGAPSPDLTGRYEFTAVKRPDGWRFRRWVVAIDQTGTP